MRFSEREMVALLGVSPKKKNIPISFELWKHVEWVQRRQNLMMN